MTNKKELFLLYFLIIIEMMILINSKDIMESVISSSKLFIIKIFPSLFPTMVMGNLLIKNNVQTIIPVFIKRMFNKLFNFNDAMTGIFITSIFTGTPSNAIYINESLDEKIISSSEAQKLLCTTHFINPLFVIGGVGIGIFKSYKIGAFLLLMIIISNFIKAFILRKKGVSNLSNKLNTTYHNVNFITSLSESIKNSINSLLMIFGIIIMFNILVNLIGNIFNLPYLLNAIINGLLEMTGGIMKISNLSINIIPKFLLAYFFLNFGGICIHMQAFGMLKNKKISYLKYLIFRVF